MKMPSWETPPQAEYEKNPDENFEFRPDVAGYEYPEEGCNWRIGIVRDVLEFNEHLDALEEILSTPFTKEITRNMARTVLTEELLQNPPPELQRVLPDLEVLISLKDSGNEDLADCYQAIFSRNAETRQTPKNIMEKEMEDAATVFHRGQEKHTSGEMIPMPANIELQRITDTSDPKIVDSFIELTSSAFAETEEDLREILEDESATIVVATTIEDGRIVVVGSVYAYEDNDTLKRNGKNASLNTFEIMGAKVRETMQNKGIYKALQTKLLNELAGKEEADVVFGYSNATSLGVFSVAGQMGRTLTMDTAKELNLQIRPAMRQTITDGKFVDEIVSYIPGNKLRELYGQK